MKTEKRLIDANALVTIIKKEIHNYWNNGEGGYYLAEDVIPDIDNAPTVDAVEVVRCKDCKYLWEISAVDRMFYCRNKHGLSGINIVEENPFCSYGERREGE